MADHPALKRNDSPLPRWLALVLAPPVFITTVWAGAWVVRAESAAIAVSGAAAGFLGIAALLALSALLRSRRRSWNSRLEELERTLIGVRAGELPLEELSGFDGPFRPLALSVQQMAAELKAHRAQLQAVEAEVRQLVAQRTDALEQKLGSMRLQANRDKLTGLYNRRAFDEQVSEAVKQAAKSPANLCLLMIDLDNFKHLNDTFGHAAGDEFLRSVGQIIRSGIRKQDIGFRFGGDEFVVLMPDATREEGEAMGQRLVGMIDSLGRILKLDRPLGASAGLSSLRDLSERTTDALLLEADRRQYETKQARRPALPAERSRA